MGGAGRKVRVAGAWLLVSAVMAAGTSFWLRAQAEDARPIASLMPAGALIYLEAKDFGGLLASWNGSAEKRRWMASANYRVMSLSRLVQRLSQAEGEFADVAGVPIGMDLTDEVAGRRSGFAFYDLSALGFVYITQMPLNRVEGTALWRGRAGYGAREVAGIPFYVKSDDEGARTIAFTSYRDWFVVATDADRMAGTLALLSGAKAASLASERWFAEVGKQSEKQGDVRLVYNLRALLGTPQFRTYWIHRNASELRPFWAGVSDLFESGEGFEEQRAMLRTGEAPATPAGADASVREVVSYAPANAGLYRAWSRPDGRQLREALQQVIGGEKPPGDIYNAPAPEVTPEVGATGSEADLEVRVDEAPFSRASENAVAPVVDALMAMRPLALLHVQSTSVLRDQVFVVPGSGAVILCEQPDRAALDRAMGRVPGLQGGPLDPLQVSVSGRAVVLSRMELKRGVTATTDPSSRAGDVTYAAVYNHAAEWADYHRLFAVIDTHAASPEMVVSNSTPAFFSGDVRSLGDSLARFRSASIVTWDAGGGVVREDVRDRLAGR